MGFKTDKATVEMWDFHLSSVTTWKSCTLSFAHPRVTETAQRPRMQCFHCGRSHDISSAGWDGALGGGQDRNIVGALDAWLTNHKVFNAIYGCPYPIHTYIGMHHVSPAATQAHTGACT